MRYLYGYRLETTPWLPGSIEYTPIGCITISRKAYLYGTTDLVTKHNCDTILSSTRAIACISIIIKQQVDTLFYPIIEIYICVPDIVLR